MLAQFRAQKHVLQAFLEAFQVVSQLLLSLPLS
jgi:hypothetical protein